MRSPTSVRIVANRPLLRAGLERWAAAAEATVCDGPEPVDLVLRATNEPADASAVDVTVIDGALVVTCRCAPTLDVWETLYRLAMIALAS